MKNLIIYTGLIFALLISSCYKDEDYLPSNTDPFAVLKELRAVSLSIPADGTSFTYIEAEIPADAIDSKSSVVFTTTKGTFENNTKTATATATLTSVNGTDKKIARVKLISTTNIESAEITATIASVSRSITVSFIPLAYDTFFSMPGSFSAVPADGASSATLTVEQPLTTTADLTSITFTTSAGLFENGTKTITKTSVITLIGAEYKRYATAKLTAGKTEEQAQIEVTVKGTSKRATVDFVRAYPETIRLTLGAPNIATGFANSVQITTTLGRKTGIPTPEQDAQLSVLDTNMVSRGTFINYTTKSDQSGNLTNKFTLGTDTYKGKLNIIATTTDASGNQLKTQYTITAQ